MNKSDKNNGKLCVLGIILVGFFLRVFRLGAMSLWFDEACSVSFASNSLNDFFSHRYIVKPVYFLLLKAWTASFGCREFSTRFLSLIFGMLSVFLIYKLARMLFNQKVAIISAFILAFSAFHINYSQQVRNYTLFGFLGLASMIFFLKWLKKNKSSDFISYLLINICLIFTHPFGVFIILTQSICLVAFIRKAKKNSINKKHRLCFLSQFLLVAFFFLITCILFKNSLNQNLQDFKYMPVPSNNLLLETFEVFASGGTMQRHGGLTRVLNYGQLFLPRLISAIFIPLFFLGVFFRKRNDPSYLKTRMGVLFLLLWVALTVSLSFAFSLLFFPIYLTRYLFATAPAFYILAARGLVCLPKRIYQLAALAAIGFLSILSLNIQYNASLNDSWKEIANCLKGNITRGDSIAFYPLDQIVPFWFYYKYEDAVPLKGIDRYGKNISGKWYSEFIDGSNWITGIGLNENKTLMVKKLARLKNRENDIWLICVNRGKALFFKKNIELSYKLKKKYCFTQEGIELCHYVPF
ncbi:MAG: glycosyltransferase family 39 protein [Candidatus Omnitrophica bacterium]|nr:glycosyltransferase family 39 protein [Candidatus Omnitrophota bacterium]